VTLLKRKRKLILGVLIILVIGVLIAPSVAVRFLRETYSHQLSKETDLDIEIGSLTTGWFSPVIASNISVATHSGEQVAFCQRIQTVTLEGPTRDELMSALAQIDIEQGLLKKLVNPERDTLAEILVSDAQIDVRPSDSDPWFTTIEGMNASVNVQHTTERDELNVTVAETPINLAPELCDFGLKFVAPVVEGAMDLQGKGLLSISRCQIQPQDLNAMELEGQLLIDGAYADIHGDLALAIGNLAVRGKQATSTEEPLMLRFAKDCEIAFNVHQGRIHHSGVRFALSDLLPNTTLTSAGSVGFDTSLDFTVALDVPFEHMGESEFLQSIGTPSISIPVSGTFDAPKLNIGKGKAVGNFLQQAVESASDGQLDITPILQNIGELGFLRGRWSSKSTDEKTKATDSKASEKEGSLEPHTKSTKPRRLLDRLRDRIRK